MSEETNVRWSYNSFIFIIIISEHRVEQGREKGWVGEWRKTLSVRAPADDRGSAEQGGEEQGRQTCIRIFCLGPAAVHILSEYSQKGQGSLLPLNLPVDTH